MRRHQRNTVIDRLRGTAILLVVGLHFFGLREYLHRADGAGPHGVEKLFGHGYLGVNMFFAISGYLIASTSVRKGERGDVRVEVPAFYVRRATRILPLLALVLALGAFMMRSMAPGPGHEYLFDMPGAAFSGWFWISATGFAFNWFRIASVSPDGVHGWFGLQWDVLWSLAVEEQFYLLFPAVIVAARTTVRLRLILWTVFAASVATRVSLTASGADWLTSATNSISCFDALSLGVLAALSDPWPVLRSKIAAVAGCAGLFTCYLLGNAGWGLSATGIAASTVLIIQASRSPESTSLILLPPLGKFGVLSYGLYLLQAFAFALLPQWISLADPVLAFAVALGVATSVAWLSFTLFERPVERGLRRRALDLLVASRVAPGRT